MLRRTLVWNPEFEWNVHQANAEAQELGLQLTKLIGVTSWHRSSTESLMSRLAETKSSAINWEKTRLANPTFRKVPWLRMLRHRCSSLYYSNTYVYIYAFITSIQQYMDTPRYNMFFFSGTLESPTHLTLLDFIHSICAQAAAEAAQARALCYSEKRSRFT